MFAKKIEVTSTKSASSEMRQWKLSLIIRNLKKLQQRLRLMKHQ
jgi:hypothetical protein